MKIKEINLGELDYPYLLSQIYSPPKKLYVLGNAQILREKSIAIVGCRDASNYGKNITKELAYNLGKNNIITVSGLAKGIDTFCHIGSVEAGARTIAVVAHGLDMIYPKENRNLAIRILKSGGAIVSEYDLGKKPLKQNFPARNRLISGLAESTVVVEAKKESGSLITANFALNEGRDVYAVPGNINNANSEGTNELIKNGANVLTSYRDLLNVEILRKL